MKLVRFLLLSALAICLICFDPGPSEAGAPVRNTLSEVAWLQDYVDLGFLQYEAARHQPLSNGAVNCNISSGVATFTDIECQQFSFLSAAYGVALGTTDPGDARDYIHHALAIITYPISQQNTSTGAYPPSPGGCGTHPSAWCTASDMTFAYGDFAHTLELLNQSTFYAQDDTEDHSIVSNTIIPSLSKGLAWLSESGSGEAYQDMQLDWTATNRIMIHAGAYYLTGAVTSSYNPSIAATGESDGLNFVYEGTAAGQHYVEFDQNNSYNPPSNFPCVPADLCPWVPASGFWIENEDQAGDASGYDSGYGGVGIHRADFLATYASGSSSYLTTLDYQLQATSTWLFKRVESSSGLISEEGNYRTCGSPNPPYDKNNCPATNVNMAWEEVAWALYNEAPFAPDVAGDTCAQYIAAARAIEYYYMPLSSYIPLTANSFYPDEQASGYHIPSPSAAAPAACSQTFSTIQQAKPVAGSRATSFVDRRAFGGGGVTLSNGDSIAIPPADGGSGARPHTVAIVYSLQGSRPQAMIVRNNWSPPIRVVLTPTGSNGSFRQFRTIDVPNVPTLPGRRNNLSLSAEPGSFGIDVSSVTLRRDLSELRGR